MTASPVEPEKGPKTLKRLVASLGGALVVLCTLAPLVGDADPQSAIAAAQVAAILLVPWIVLASAPLPRANLSVVGCGVIMGGAYALFFAATLFGPHAGDALTAVDLLLTVVPLGLGLVTIAAVFDAAVRGSERESGAMARDRPMKACFTLEAALVTASWSFLGTGLLEAALGPRVAVWPPFLWGPLSLVAPLWLFGGLVPLVVVFVLPWAWGVASTTTGGRKAKAALALAWLINLVLVIGAIAGIALGPRDMISLALWIIQLALAIWAGWRMSQAVLQPSASG